MNDTKPDYKQTIYLPITNFPMKANSPTREPKTLKLWQDLSIYKKISEKNQGKPQYILHDCPSYENLNILIVNAVN
jgi:isoleucyl-tRNA synthetase